MGFSIYGYMGIQKVLKTFENQIWDQVTVHSLSNFLSH